MHARYILEKRLNAVHKEYRQVTLRSMIVPELTIKPELSTPSYMKYPQTTSYTQKSNMTRQKPILWLAGMVIIHLCD